MITNLSFCAKWKLFFGQENISSFKFDFTSLNTCVTMNFIININKQKTSYNFLYNLFLVHNISKYLQDLIKYFRVQKSIK